MPKQARLGYCKLPPLGVICGGGFNLAASDTPKMALELATLQALLPRATPYKVTDGKGLYLLIQPNGARYWRFRYRWAGKQNTLSCGVYPEVTLDEARSRRDAFRAILAQDANPSEHTKAERAELKDEKARQESAMRFMLDNDGALYFRLGNRRLTLTPAETLQLRSFLDATRNLNSEVMPCP